MLAADPCVVGLGPARGFLTRDPAPSSTAPEPTMSHSLSPSRVCAATPYTNHCPEGCPLQAQPRSFRGSGGVGGSGGPWGGSGGSG